MSKILVIIPMYGKAEYTHKCIEMTLENAGVHVDILVVDDGSPEPFTYDSEKQVSVLRLAQNSGFTNACNQGILWALGMYDYVHLLNNDTEPQANFIKPLLDILEDDETVAIASSVRLHPKDDSYEVELYGLDLIRGYQCVTSLEHLKEEIIQCNWVPLCSSLVRTSVISEIGILDKHMRTHSSDLDYCLRVKMADYKIVLDTNSRVIHHHEVTTKAHGITPERDQMVLLEKLAGLPYAQFLAKMPLDAAQKTYGQLEFKVYQK